MSYNELGQLTSKARSECYESQLFQYNIRGWLTRLSCEVFNEDLCYEKTSNGGLLLMFFQPIPKHSSRNLANLLVI